MACRLLGVELLSESMMTYRKLNTWEKIIETQIFSCNKIHLKMSSAKWQPFFLGLNELMNDNMHSNWISAVPFLHANTFPKILRIEGRQIIYDARCLFGVESITYVLFLSLWSCMQCHLSLINNMITEPGARFNVKMTSYQYRKIHCGVKTVVRSSYLHNGICYTGKMASLHWIGALVVYVYNSSPTWSSSPKTNTQQKSCCINRLPY